MVSVLRSSASMPKLLANMQRPLAVLKLPIKKLESLSTLSTRPAVILPRPLVRAHRREAMLLWPLVTIPLQAGQVAAASSPSLLVRTRRRLAAVRSLLARRPLPSTMTPSHSATTLVRLPPVLRLSATVPEHWPSILRPGAMPLSQLMKNPRPGARTPSPVLNWMIMVL